METLKNRQEKTYWFITGLPDINYNYFVSQVSFGRSCRDDQLTRLLHSAPRKQQTIKSWGSSQLQSQIS